MMNTEADFKKELKELLRKYNVHMSIEEFGDYPEINFYRWEAGNIETIDWYTRYENGEDL